jgi:hypothetical protein
LENKGCAMISEGSVISQGILYLSTFVKGVPNGSLPICKDV